MWPAASLLMCTSSRNHSLKAWTYSGVSKLLPRITSFTQPRQYSLLPSTPHAEWINGTHWMRRMRQNLNFMAVTISNSVPCSVSVSDRMLKVSDERQKSEAFVVRRATFLDDLQ